ncbi:hypothetical protein MINTM008_08460 [Mycobacterium intracellulare]|uniref:Uncharacterized protein n=8 Tax=Mycobacteriaceae TaxID=1762 RepID=A0A557XEJ7_9MYCO|nr:hypothetical protein BWK49_04810 [Mycobacterium intracellulare subsp. chimaera]KKC02118.1 hypothetical protein WU83_25835 [Mycobacterium nebraskense]KRQ34204.1 hypothetical protein AOT91_07055 [Mycobacteroides sp. H092]KRQ45805.1 hypothetical protein AOT88_19535 [Mycobacteroides sp. H063]KRQ85686.1 hypothetical protein AOT93_00390 [Mycobacteroides sp. H110]OBS00620.1 hypothetical protein A9W98_24100 [Mycobacterium gordonae]OHU33070.1 hypothetical protein BKG74_00035 [Mycobacteroides chelon
MPYKAIRFLIIAPPQRRRAGITLSGQAVKFEDQVLAGDAARHPTVDAFAGVFVDDRDDL